MTATLRHGRSPALRRARTRRLRTARWPAAALMLVLAALAFVPGVSGWVVTTSITVAERVGAALAEVIIGATSPAHTPSPSPHQSPPAAWVLRPQLQK